MLTLQSINLLGPVFSVSSTLHVVTNVKFSLKLEEIESSFVSSKNHADHPLPSFFGIIF